MSNRLQVVVAKDTGLPYAAVPAPNMWKLVEFLQEARTPVTYAYKHDHFTVCFTQVNPAAAQRMLDEWAGAK